MAGFWHPPPGGARGQLPPLPPPRYATGLSCIMLVSCCLTWLENILVLLNSFYNMFYIYMSSNLLEACNLYIHVVCIHSLISYSLSDNNNLEGARPLLQYSPTMITIGIDVITIV